MIRYLVQTSSSPGSTLRSPQMIQFGKYDISTWYSSPYPQVRKKEEKSVTLTSFLFVLEYTGEVGTGTDILKKKSEKSAVQAPH